MPIASFEMRGSVRTHPVRCASPPVVVQAPPPRPWALSAAAARTNRNAVAVRRILIVFSLLRLGPHPQALTALRATPFGLAVRYAGGRSPSKKHRAEGPIFAWGWGPTRAGGGGAPPATKNADTPPKSPRCRFELSVRFLSCARGPPPTRGPASRRLLLTAPARGYYPSALISSAPPQSRPPPAAASPHSPPRSESTRPPSAHA